MTKSVNIKQFNFYDDVPLSTEDRYFIESLLGDANITASVINKKTKTYHNTKINRNSQIIRWFFFGLGVMRIEELMYLSDIRDRITTKPITIIVNRFLSSIDKDKRAEFEEKRKVNLSSPYGEKVKTHKMYRNKRVEAEKRNER